MNLVRQYKLYRLGIGNNPLSEDLILFLDSKFKGLIRFQSVKFIKITFYFDKDEKSILEYSNSNMHVRSEIWTYLKNKHLLKEEDIKTLCKYWIEKEYSIRINNIYINHISNAYLIRTEYKQTL